MVICSIICVDEQVYYSLVYVRRRITFLMFLNERCHGTDITTVKGLSPARPPTPTVLRSTLDNNVQKVICATLIGEKPSDTSFVSCFVIVKSRPFSQRGCQLSLSWGGSGTAVHVTLQALRFSLQQRTIAALHTHDWPLLVEGGNIMKSASVNDSWQILPADSRFFIHLIIKKEWASQFSLDKTLMSSVELLVGQLPSINKAAFPSRIMLEWSLCFSILK